MRLRKRREAGAVATYAAVLDGAHLWLDVDGPVSVRQVDDKDVTEPVTEPVTELGQQPVDLTVLTGNAYEVLAGKTPVELTTLPERPLSRTPESADGMSRWQVGRRESGRLLLTRTSLPPTAELEAVHTRGDRLHLRIRPADGVEPGEHLLLLDTDDQVRSTLSVTAREGLLEALVGVDDLPAGYFGVLRLAVGTDHSWVRIRRAANDLADPNHAVLLPELYADPGPGGELGPDRPRARLRWNPDGLLALRSIDPDEQP